MDHAAASPTRADLARYFLRLGTTGFGGPVALVGAMHSDLVEGRGWYSEDEYREGMALAQLSPGPLATQLCFYLGYLRGGVGLAALAGLAFVLPSFVMVVALGWAYVRFGGLPWMQAAFYGVGAAVIGVITKSTYGLARKSIGIDRLLWGIFVVVAVVTAWTGKESVLLILGAGALVWGLRMRPRPATAMEGGSLLLLLSIAGFFAYAGTFVFGSGLAIVPFLHGGVVLQHQWLTEPQFHDAVAVALLTPGPVVITTGFVGYLIAGLPGAIVASGATFLPCFLLTVLPAPYFQRHGKTSWLAAIVAGITAGATGAIGGAVIVLARGSVVDGWTAAIAVAAFAGTWLPGRFRDPLIVLAGAGLGLLLRS